MKKLIFAAIAILGFAFSSPAQEKAKTVKKTQTETKIVKKDGKVTKKTEEKVVLKKDGTPDKRYKTSKTTVLKKDGTPDKRYKENK